MLTCCPEPPACVIRFHGYQIDGLHNLLNVCRRPRIALMLSSVRAGSPSWPCSLGAPSAADDAEIRRAAAYLICCPSPNYVRSMVISKAWPA
jgi:hypothetical protein